MQDNFTTQNKIPPEPSFTHPPLNNGIVNAYSNGFIPKSYIEKAEIKRAANVAGGSLLALMGVSFVGVLIYSLILIFMSRNLFEIKEDSALAMAFQAFISILSFTLPTILIYKLCGYYISGLVPLKKSEKGTVLPVFFFGVAFCAFSNIASSFIDNLFSSFGVNYSPGDFELPEGVWGFLLSTIAISVVPALVEEFACRGLILGSLRKFGDGFAVIASAAVFGILHSNFEQIPFAFSVGLILGYSVIITGSLRVSMAIHFFNNFISIFFDYFLGTVTTEIQNIIYMAFLMFSLLAGVICLKAGKTDTEIFKFKKGDTECTEKEKYKWFFSSAAIIVFVVLCLFEAMAYVFNKV